VLSPNKCHVFAVDKSGRSLIAEWLGDIIARRIRETDMSTQFCDHYRERNVSNPRELLALRNIPVDLKKWEPVSFGQTPSSKIAALASQGYVIVEYTSDLLKRVSRRYRNGAVSNSRANAGAVFRLTSESAASRRETK
jgi:hypothetical protein